MRHAFRLRVLAELRVGNLTHIAKDIAFVLSGYPSHAYCWPSHATLADRAACSVRTVQRSLERLRTLGLMDWTPRYRPGRGRGHRASNVYRLAVPKEAVRALWPARRAASEKEVDDLAHEPDHARQNADHQCQPEAIHAAFLASYAGHDARRMEILGSKRPTRPSHPHARPEPHAPVRTVAEQIALLRLPHASGSSSSATALHHCMCTGIGIS